MRCVVVACVLLGCGRDQAAAPVANTAPPLFADAEIAALQTAVLARLDENPRRACPGPKLLEDQTPGSSAADLAQLVERTGDVSQCMTKLGAVADLDGEILHRAPAAIALDDECGPVLEAAFHRGAAHAEGCSAYQIGVRGDRSYLPVMQAASLLAFHAQRTAETDAPRALRSVLDGLRLFQDLERGHVNLLAAMVAAAAIELVGRRADAILDTAKLSKTQLAELAGALDRLVAAAPPFHDLLAGEHDALDLLGVVPLEPPTWTPPGGWGETINRPARLIPPGKHFARTRDESAAVLSALDQNGAAREAACPATATLVACAAALDALPRAREVANLDRDLEAAAHGGNAGKARDRVVAILRAIDAPALRSYVVKHAATLARLAELRIHVEMLQRGSCAAPPEALAAPAMLGVPLDIKIGGGAVDIAPPLGGTATLHFSCPR